MANFQVWCNCGFLMLWLRKLQWASWELIPLQHSDPVTNDNQSVSHYFCFHPDLLLLWKFGVTLSYYCLKVIYALNSVCITLQNRSRLWVNVRSQWEELVCKIFLSERALGCVTRYQRSLMSRSSRSVLCRFGLSLLLDGSTHLS